MYTLGLHVQTYTHKKMHVSGYLLLGHLSQCSSAMAEDLQTQALLHSHRIASMLK